MFGNRTLDRLDQMLDEAQSGTFRESDYDETKLSRLESKWKQFLAASVISKENLEREKDNIKELVSDISHQTKTPMTNIRMYAELLDESLRAEASGKNVDESLRAEASGKNVQRQNGASESANDRNRRLLAEIIRQTDKLDFLIQSLNKLSRLESGIVAVRPERTALCELISGTVDSIAPKAREREIQIVNTYAGNGTAQFDLKWTKEALENVLDNAVKYSPVGSRITVSVREYQIYAAVAVRDQGIGISEEDMARIFGRFYRGEAVAQQEGVGIGLYLARQILSRENGYIKVDSAPGKGSEFSLYLLR